MRFDPIPRRGQGGAGSRAARQHSGPLPALLAASGPPFSPRLCAGLHGVRLYAPPQAFICVNLLPAGWVSKAACLALVGAGRRCQRRQGSGRRDPEDCQPPQAQSHPWRLLGRPGLGKWALRSHCPASLRPAPPLQVPHICLSMLFVTS